MIKASLNVKFFINLAKLQSILNRRFDSALNGLGLNEFIILYHLSQAPKETLRRIELADKVGLTASGITRLLLPMEKIGLVKSGEKESDARVRGVMLAPGGKQKLIEAMERAELLTKEILPSNKKGRIKEFSNLFSELVGRIYMS